MNKERESFLLGKSAGLATARILFGQLKGISEDERFKFYKEMDSKVAEIQIELETEKRADA